MKPNWFSGKALHRKVLFNAFLFLPLLLNAEISPTQKSLQAYRAVLSLQFKEASAIISESVRSDPENIFPVYLENYRDFLTAFISGEDQDVNSLEKSFGSRIRLFEKSEDETPYRNYLAGNMYLQHAIIKMNNGSYLSAASDVSSAWNLFSRCEKKYKNFIPVKAGLGLLHILAGSVPEHYKGILSFAGFKGNTELGMAELREVISYSGNDPFTSLSRSEALLYLAIAEGSLSSDKMKAVKLIRDFESAGFDFQRKENPVYIFVKATVFMQAGLNDEALDVLAFYKPVGESYPLYFLDYLRGKAKLNRLDADADFWLQRFVTHYKGKTWIKSAYLRLAWHSLITGKTGKYDVYCSMAGIYGSARAETDRQAQREAGSEDPVSLPLLKARMLFDGGYYDRALDLMLGTSLDITVHNKKDLVEYNYRMGRIYQEKEIGEKALFYFEKTIKSGSAEPWYFAANAALQSGLIKEKEGEYRDAISFFKQCLQMEPAEYKTSLDRKAKAGIERVQKYLD